MVSCHQDLKRSHSLHQPSQRGKDWGTHLSSPLSENRQQRGLYRTSRSENQWVAFPPLPEAAIHSFSSAVQFVSTSLKPLTEPSIAYPSGPLPNNLSRANGFLSTSSKLNSIPISKILDESSVINQSGGLKRSRTTTSSSLSSGINRQRSKSDFNSMSNRLGPGRPFPCESLGPILASDKKPGFGSSTSLCRPGIPDSTRRRPATPESQPPVSLIRHKHRVSEAATELSARKKRMQSSPYPRYMCGAAKSSSSLKSIPSSTSISTLYPSRSRAQSQLNVIPSESQEENIQAGPVRRTYLGGVGVYLNPNQHDEESSLEEISIPRTIRINDSKANPDLTINVELCQGSAHLSKSTRSWYSRLLLSPLSSASSSVYSFLVNTSTPPTSSEGGDEPLEEGKEASEVKSVT